MKGKKRVIIQNIIPQHLESLISKLKEMGVKMENVGDSIIVYGDNKNFNAVDVRTQVYPGFATDLQQPLTALLTQANGQSQVIETIYPERFRHCEQLNKMGANIELDESMCYINGKTPLKGAKVEATDLRCGAALLIAGLIADGITEISNVYHIDRGYANIDQKLITLGAVIRRIKVDEFNRVEGMNNVFAIGDQCIQTSDKDYPNGHPQLAQVAIQQGKLLAENLKRIEKGKSLKPFHYRNLGSMATVGRNRAVAEFSKIKMQGWFAWVMWLVVHLRSILGVRNKVVVLLNWIWNYLTYDQSLRMIVYAKKAKEVREREALEARTHLGNDILHPDNK